MTADELFAQEVQVKVARAELIKRVLIVVTTVVVSVSLVMTYFTLRNSADTVNAIRATQTKGSPLLLAIQSAVDAAISTNEQIADCLEPTGDCYHRSQQRQAVFYYALVCLDRPGTMTLPDLRKCTADLFAEYADAVRLLEPSSPLRTPNVSTN